MPSVITTSQIIMGAHTDFQVGPWVTAKGAGTLVDVGSTMKAVTLDQKTTYHEIIVAQRLGAVDVVPTKREYELKITFAEATMANLIIAIGQPTANLSGGVLLWDPSAVQIPYQVKMISKGVTGKVRTAIFWKLYAKAIAPISIHKESETLLDVTFGGIEEVTGTGLDNICKITEA